MKLMLLTSLSILLLKAHAPGQTTVPEAIMAEGAKLYRSEMASWYGTDLFREKLAHKIDTAGGYFSYVLGEKAVCVFFSRGDKPRAIATFTFDSTYAIRRAAVDSVERGLTVLENCLCRLREMAVKEFQSDTMFHAYKGMATNFIPLDDDKGKRVYILTAPLKDGIVVFGNDYLLTFDNEYRLTAKRRLHKNIIVSSYLKRDAQDAISMHTHLDDTDSLITATDICTLRLYERYAHLEKAFVFSKSMVFIWDCLKDNLTVMTRAAWREMYGEAKEEGKE